MHPISIGDIVQAVGGKTIAPIPDANNPIIAVCTDTRAMKTDSLYIAIRGEKFDGHQFLDKAAAGGARAMIVSSAPAESFPGIAVIVVPDTRIALGQLARFGRKQLRGKVIDVAGSNGKTSTKHLVHAALSGALKGSMSPKSFNNDIGVPLTIFPADPNDDYLVLEIGTNHHGEIRPLSDMSLPDIAVLTNCGADHLEGLGDLDGVRRENAKIVSGLNPKGLLIVNGDDPELVTAVKNWTGRRVTFGYKSSNDLIARDLHCTIEGTEFSTNVTSKRVYVPMLGRHSALNTLAAIAVTREMGVTEDTMIQSLAKAKGPEMRLQVQFIGDIVLLNDAYNANPNSMRAAIETLTDLESRGRRIAILGDMRELGVTSEKYHREIGALAASSKKIDLLFCVGAESRYMAEDAIAAGMSAKAVFRYDDAVMAAAEVPGLLLPRDLVLLKASRGIHLEAVAGAMNRSSPS